MQSVHCERWCHAAYQHQPIIYCKLPSRQVSGILGPLHSFMLAMPLQGIEDHFIEQWHQKLHTNTTPEDITICEAYLAFLHSGYDGDFWRVLWDNGRITREMLATMDHPITGE